MSWRDPRRFSVGLGVGGNGGVAEAAYEIDPHFLSRGQGAFSYCPIGRLGLT